MHFFNKCHRCHLLSANIPADHPTTFIISSESKKLHAHRKNPITAG